MKPENVREILSKCDTLLENRKKMVETIEELKASVIAETRRRAKTDAVWRAVYRDLITEERNKLIADNKLKVDSLGYCSAWSHRVHASAATRCDDINKQLLAMEREEKEAERAGSGT